MDEVFEQEFNKGEIAGIEFARNFPQVRLEIVRAEIKSLTQEIEHESDAEATVSSADGIDSGDGRLDLDPFTGRVE